ncbi:recombinase family protein [Paenibacillus naphthalenovorans]|uniref:recombinase family protein n=1 Tax=Paenibacillus naphthalenovorans TaxID=162209 RepID=UPI003D29D76D
MDKIRVAAYCRVSTNSKDQSNSFENQYDYFLDRAKKTDNEELVEIYADKGTTGTSLKKREEFKRMIYDAGINEHKGNKKFTYEIDPKRKPKFQKIYVRNTSRFARDTTITEILRELVKNGVYVHFLDIDLIYDGIDKEFMLNLFLNFSQQESVDRSKKVRDGNEISAQKGVIRVGGKGIYGYEYIKETKSLSIIEEEANIVRKIYELYLNGYGIRRILNYLEQNNIKPRGNSNRFAINMIKRILTNEKYYGCNVRNKYDLGTVFNKKSYAHLKEETEWIKHDDSIPAIIDKETFEKAQLIRRSKKHHEIQIGVYKGTTEYAGIITCAKCGSNYTRNIDKGRIFYNCSRKKSLGVTACDNININQSKIDQAVEKTLEKGINKSFNEYKELIIEFLNIKVRTEIVKQINRDTENEVNQLKEKRNYIIEQQNRLADLYISGDINKEYLDKRAAGLKEELYDVDEQIKELSKTNEEIYAEIKEFDNIIDHINNVQIEEVKSKQDLLNLISMKIQRNPNNVNEPLILMRYKFDDNIKRLANKYKVLEGLSLNIPW